jgi:D-3-phosphoglycerate dehydrogenase
LAVTKEDLLKKSDFITIHTVLSDRTKNLITKKDLQLMKETAFLINTSRGPIVNEFDLVEALEKNIIAGAGLDVYEIEPLAENHKLRFLSNALLLPHLGYVTKENYEIFYSQMFENLQAFKAGKPIRVIQLLN